MELNSLLIALPVFFVLYSGVGMLLENRKDAPSGWGRPQGVSKKAVGDLLGRVANIGLNKAILRNKNFHDRLELLLLRSGNVLGWSVEVLLLYKELAAVTIVAFLWALNQLQPLYVLLGVGAGFYLPDLYLNLKVGERKAEIQRHLPGYIDILALTLESGLDLLAATERILEKMKPNALRAELNTLLQENRLGTARKEALQHLAHRTDVSDVQSLTSMIIQSEELGTSLAAVLRGYAEDMRSKRILRAEEIAGKAPVKLLFPMMVFFFPIVFIVIFGPLALNLMSSYK